MYKHMNIPFKACVEPLEELFEWHCIVLDHGTPQVFIGLNFRLVRYFLRGILVIFKIPRGIYKKMDLYHFVEIALALALAFGIVPVQVLELVAISCSLRFLTSSKNPQEVIIIEVDMNKHSMIHFHNM